MSDTRGYVENRLAGSASHAELLRLTPEALSKQKNGSWGKAELVKEPYINLHVASVALNYGQSVSMLFSPPLVRCFANAALLQCFEGVRIPHDVQSDYQYLTLTTFTPAQSI